MSVIASLPAVDRRRVRKALKGIAMMAPRRPHVAIVNYSINERAELAIRLVDRIDAGRVGVIRDGIDCDCSQYHREKIIDFSGLYSFWLHELRHADGLDGPEGTHYCHPVHIDLSNNTSRDLALEAFEEGRPHAVCSN